jgi:OOP family OmpA-OmpF porin
VTIGIRRPAPLQVLAFSLLGLSGWTLAGCGAQEAVPPAGEMVLIAGNRQGVPSIVDSSGRHPEILVSSLRQQLMSRFDRDMTVSIIAVDGDSQAQATEPFELDTRNGEKRKQSPEDNVLKLSGVLADERASSGEADQLAALDAGGRASSSADNKTRYVYDSGVSTAGPLAMQNGLLGKNTDVSTIVQSLRAVGNLPFLDGVVVHWWGLAQVVAPQSDIPIWARTKLRDLWTAVIQAGGGSVVFHDDAIVATQPLGDLPTVTAVTFDDAQAKPVSLTIPESQISFRPETADFAEPGAAETALKEIALALVEPEGNALWVTGCTANPAGASPSLMQQLSERRAQRVADELARAGIAANFNVQGLGPACPGRTPESGSSSEIEASQAKNRRVLVTSRGLLPVTVQD